MKTPEDAVQAVNATSQFVPVDWVPITPGQAHPVLRGIRANAAGTVTVKTARSGSSTRVLNFLAGETRWGMFVEVTSATATGLEGAV